MNTEETVKVLSTLTTRDEAGRHFTSLLSSTTISTLEAEGLVTVSRPVHSTGIPFSEEHWTIEVTPEGVELVGANPEYVTSNCPMTLEYRILKSTRNAGQYVGDRVASLSAAKTMIRAEHPGRRIRWREEGSDVCAYLSAEDMEDADKAVARLRPVAAC